MTQRAFTCLLSLAALSVSLCAAADPLPLRGPAIGVGGVVVYGVPDFAVGAWLSPRVGVAMEYRAPLGAWGGSIGFRAPLLGRDRGWGVDAGVAGGLMTPLATPGLAVSLTPTVQLRVRAERFHAAIGVASPAAFLLLGNPAARIPLLAEIWVAGRVRDVWLGAQAGAGIVFMPSLSPSIALQASVYVAVELPH